MKRTLNRLDSTQRKIATTIGTLETGLFRKRPAENEWSIAEVIHHLRLVEERVLSDLNASVQRPQGKVGMLKKLVPMRIVSLRFYRVKAPKAVQPGNPPPKEDVIRNYNDTRARLKQFCAEHGRARLRQISFRHPILGNLDGVAAISMVAFHEQRHYKQIREILKKLSANSRQPTNSKQQTN